MFFLNTKIERKIPKSGKSYLLNVMKIGEEKREAFAYECQKTLKDLRRISKVQQFTKKNESKQIKKLVDVRGTRDYVRATFLFGNEKRNQFKYSISFSDSIGATLLCSH